MTRYRFTSLLLVEERLLEADHFARRLYRQPHSVRFGYELNAFLSAARSVTFLLQKEMAKVADFPSWWEEQQSQLRSDRSPAFSSNSGTATWRNAVASMWRKWRL